MNFPVRHKLSVDGYNVGDRLLEGVLFEIEIEESPDGVLTIGEIKPEKSAESYLANIRWENFVPALRSEVQYSIDHLAKSAQKSGRTMRSVLEEFARETGLPEIEILDEV